MGKRGPKPRPVETLRLIGSREQYNRKGEVAIVSGEPLKPRSLGEYGSAMWDRRAEQLRNQGIISEAWQETMEVLCEAWERYHVLLDECRMLAVNDPLWGDLRSARADFWKCAADFGLTPAAKTGIRTEPKPAGKDKGRFVKGTG